MSRHDLYDSVDGNSVDFEHEGWERSAPGRDWFPVVLLALAAIVCVAIVVLGTRN